MGRAYVMLTVAALYGCFFFSTCCYASLGQVGLTTLPLVHLQGNQHSKVQEHFVAGQGGGGSSGGHMAGIGGGGNGGSSDSGSSSNVHGGGGGTMPAYAAGGGANIHRNNNHHSGGSCVQSSGLGFTATTAVILAFILKEIYVFVF